MKRRAFIAAWMLVMLSACGSSGEPQSEDYGNILNSPAGLVLVESEHPTGWGRPECFACHEIRNFHIVNRTGLPDCPLTPPATPIACLDLAQVRAIVLSQGGASCAQCHGPNGVPTPTATPTQTGAAQ
jgi:mono/diheme cytochrome c family protein